MHGAREQAWLSDPDQDKQLVGNHRRHHERTRCRQSATIIDDRSRAT